MRINSISNYSISNRQNFGARLDNNTKALIRDAKRYGMNTDRMEELMEELYPDGEVHTSLFDGEMADEKTKNVVVNYVLIGILVLVAIVCAIIIIRQIMKKKKEK